MECIAHETTDQGHDDGTGEANKRLVRRYVEDVVNSGQTACLDDLVADDHVLHGPLGNHCGLESIRLSVYGIRAAFPDLRFEITHLLAEGDRVARRWVATGTHAGDFLGIGPTGRRIRLSGIAIDRVVAGKLAETWLDYDILGLLRQLGAGAALTADARRDDVQVGSILQRSRSVTLL
jgi:predicted ester cyclase